MCGVCKATCVRCCIALVLYSSIVVLKAIYGNKVKKPVCTFLDRFAPQEFSHKCEPTSVGYCVFQLNLITFYFATS